jgi:hypothetical protein
MRVSLLALSVLAAAQGVAIAATPTFFARRDYPDSAAQWIQVADTRGDNIPDVIALSGSNIDVLFGNGNGTFKQGPTSASGVYSAGTFVTADLNGDGNIDLVFSGDLDGQSQNGIGVSFGNGDGTFQPAILYPAGTDMYVGEVVTGDFNGDGVPDAATPGESGLWLFTGKGGGAFNSPTLIPFNGSVNAVGWISIADFNKDGKLDLAVATDTGFAVFLGNGDGTFQTPKYYTAPRIAFQAVGDLDRDGYPDIALVAQASPNHVFLYLNNGSGGFSGPSYAYLPGYSILTIGDVNGDGIPDLVNGDGYIAFGDGNGEFKPPVYYPIDSSLLGSHNPVLADLRNNGLTDIVVQGSLAVSVLLSKGGGKFEDGIWTALPGAIACGAAADFNGDGKPDLAVLTAQNISILLGTGTESAPFTPGSSIALSGAGCPVAADLTGNGTQDLLVPSQQIVLSYLGTGNGTFNAKGSVVFPAAFDAYAIGDFNHNGHPGIATSSFYIAYGNGDGTFRSPVSFWTNPPYCEFPDIAAGDLNNDGFADLIVTCNSTNSLYVFLNNQHGGFNQSTVTGREPLGLLLADVNGDGNLDVLFSSYFTPAVYIYLGDGHGGLTPKQSIPFLNGPSPFVVADVNGDGNPDLLQLNPDSIAVFFGSGNGTFAKNGLYLGTGPSPGQFFTQNLHGQSAAAGLPDIVLPDGSGGVRVLLNQTK